MERIERQRPGGARVRGSRLGVCHSAPPQRLTRVFDTPILAWQRLETEPLDAAYYVLLATGEEQVLWINQRAPQEPKIGRCVAAAKLLPELCPPIVRADTTRTRLEYPYLITRYLPSPTLADAWPHLDERARARAAEAWGRTLRALHHVRADLAGDLAYPESEGRRLGDALEAQWQRALVHAVKDHMVDTPKLTRALQRGLETVEGAPIALCHGSPNADALLFDPPRGRVVKVLNWFDASRADPMVDLAAIYFTDLAARGVQKAFLRGYGPLSVWERERLTFYQLHLTLLGYARALTHLPHQIARYRLQLAERLKDRPPL
ncbi:phosphotransferase family protein [Truepera radiovictrix]|uniref:Aminoglycoside phosphotransferase n=1 Tax=Truepera radiovictrix (strain DSM 17093 / CIP 108686 / LMG 22925 / RQ-24) TaxID=649638 RepID=D7CWN7_TRURR|nr:aminoglycoside phosphotransferase family protein [Truepera radiovictrix]ADI14436.1 aminoglycoside phosphotransferase [Truepera radiovictrix DSM 17093]WMT57007.1 aminoglycoside phosphotransferase family protein [Truepera radiovictrix]